MFKDRNFLGSILFVGLGIFFSAFYFQSPIHDFGNYYFGSKFALQGINIHDIYEPYKFNLLIRELPDLRGQQFLENYAVVPPFTLLCYIPFSFIDIYTAKLFFNLFSVLVFCFFLFRLLRHLEINSRLVFLLPLLLIVPFRNNILFGQTYLLLTGLLMAGFIFEQKKKNIIAALFYAIPIALKISPAILLFYLLARKNFKVFFLVILFTSLFFLSAIYFTGWNFMQQYIFDFIPRMSENEINNPYATTYQSITVLLRNLFIPDLLLNPAALFNSVFAFKIFSGLLTGILFFFFARQLLKSKDNFAAFSFTLLSGCLLTAYTSSYSLIFLLPFCITAIKNTRGSFTFSFASSRLSGLREMISSPAAYLLLIFLICTIPVNAFQSLPLLLRFPRLYLLLILFFTFCYENQLFKINWKWFSLCLLMFISTSILFSKHRDKSQYFL
ncbi:MAG: glycosyltransferase family 87 protein, partial [Bacteroidota bacterium]